jgi:hypothetical protein
MVPTRRNLVALAFTAVLPISVRPAGYFLIGGVLFLMLFWAGQRRKILYWGLCPLIALLIVLYGLDHTIQGRASISHAGANLFPHVARLYDRPPAGLPPEIAAETQGPILKSYQLALNQSANWQDRHALEENNFNLILNELGNTIKRKLFLAPGQTLRDLSQFPQAAEQRAKKFEKFLLDLALYTIKEHPIGYLQTVLENLAAWYVEYVFYNAPDTGDRLAREYDQFWPTGQEFMSNFGIPPITVTLSEATTDYLLTRPEALVLPFKTSPGLLPWIRVIYLASGLLATAAFLVGYGGRSAGFLAYVAVLAFGGALLVSLSTVFIPRYAIPLDPLILIVVFLGPWNALAAVRPALRWMIERVPGSQTRAKLT